MREQRSTTLECWPLVAAIVFVVTTAHAGLKTTTTLVDPSASVSLSPIEAFDCDGTPGMTVEWITRWDSDPGFNRVSYLYSALDGSNLGRLAGFDYVTLGDVESVACRCRSNAKTFPTDITNGTTHQFACVYCGSTTTGDCAVAGNVCAYQDGALLGCQASTDAFSSTATTTNLLHQPIAGFGNPLTSRPRRSASGQ